MPLRIIFIRHAQTTHNAASQWAGRFDSPLTDLGHTQAEHLGQYLSSHYTTPSRILVSTLQRTSLTASHVYPPPEVLKREVFADLKERDFGAVDNMPHTQRPPIEGVETVESVERRCEGFLRDVIRGEVSRLDDSERVIVVVSHGAYLPVLWDAIKREPNWEWIDPRPEGAERENVLGAWRNTAFCVLRWETGENEVKVVVERGMGTPHLEGGEVTRQPVAVPGVGEEGSNL